MKKIVRPGDQVVGANFRFHVIEDRLLRMEWAKDGLFNDDSTIVVEQRPAPHTTVQIDSSVNELVLDTGKMVVRYTICGRKFTRSTLEVSFTHLGKKVRWYPGLKDAKNLKATAPTLDCCNGDMIEWNGKKKKLPLGQGLLSRNGWSLIDDSMSPILTTLPDGRRWVEQQDAQNRQDWYFLAYGHDYKEALAAAQQVFGRQALPPRYTLGYWWSRYWEYTDQELETLVDEFDALDIPLDVLVVDMDWHKPGWTGYTWENHYFPDYRDFLKKMKDRGLKITLNLHPALGVGDHEVQFEAMCKALGKDPEKTKAVAFNCMDPKYMAAYFKLLHHPYEKEGVDFWWMDWQQGECTGIQNLGTGRWLNFLHWQDMAQQPGRKRPLIFSRYGGLGSGRYPIGFSGDTHSTWKSLAFQPYFTATAANVLYGYWSHDIGGHRPGEIKPELYLRWLQWGVFSPVVRTHTTKNKKAERRIFAYPAPYSFYMADVLRFRYSIIPYIYTENRKCYDTGVSLVRPMYYDWPKPEESYACREQFMCGDHLLVAPVVQPVDPKTDLAEVSVWLPAGDWIDTATGEWLKGNKTHHRKYLLQETPVFVRPGTVLPGQENQQRESSGSYENLTLTVYPGKEGSYTLYEDDGVTTDYQQGDYATIKIKQKGGGPLQTVQLDPAKGDFDGFKKMRSLTVFLEGVQPPSKVLFNGKPIRWRSERKGSCWSVDRHSSSTVIQLPKVDVTVKNVIKITYASPRPVLKHGLKGRLARLSLLREQQTALREVTDALQVMNRIARAPQTANEEIRHMERVIKSLGRKIQTEERRWKKQKGVTDNPADYTKALAILKNL